MKTIQLKLKKSVTTLEVEKVSSGQNTD
jgi:hypothetical protein